MLLSHHIKVKLFIKLQTTKNINQKRSTAYLLELLGTIHTDLSNERTFDGFELSLYWS